MLAFNVSRFDPPRGSAEIATASLYGLGMPICIECRYPVPQLYHVSQSSSKPVASSAVPSAAASPTNVSASSLHAPLSRSKASTSANATSTGRTARPAAGQAKKNGVAGRDVRLMQCPRCKRFADKYVEHDFVVLFIDLVLVKPQVSSACLGRDRLERYLCSYAYSIVSRWLINRSQVYRHLLFNRLGRSDDAFDVRRKPPRHPTIRFADAGPAIHHPAGNPPPAL